MKLKYMFLLTGWMFLQMTFFVEAADGLKGFLNRPWPGNITGDIRTITEQIQFHQKDKPVNADSVSSDRLSYVGTAAGNLNFDLKAEQGERFAAGRIGIVARFVDTVNANIKTEEAWVQAGLKTLDAKVGYFAPWIGFHSGTWMVTEAPFTNGLALPANLEFAPRSALALHWKLPSAGFSSQFYVPYGTPEGVTDRNMLGFRPSLQYLKPGSFLILGFAESTTTTKKDPDLDDKKQNTEAGIRSMFWFGAYNIWLNYRVTSIDDVTYSIPKSATEKPIKSESEANDTTLGTAFTYQFSKDIYDYLRVGIYQLDGNVNNKASGQSIGKVEKQGIAWYLGYSFPLEVSPDVYLRFGYYSNEGENTTKVSGKKISTTQGHVSKVNMRFDWAW